MARALGYATGQQVAFAKAADAWGNIASTMSQPGAAEELPADVVELAAEVEHFPRHLGIHSGGMVLCDRPVVEVCPVAWGRLQGREGATVRADVPIRSVLKWDTADCADAGLVTFELRVSSDERVRGKRG